MCMAMHAHVESYDLSDIKTAARLYGWEARKSGYVVKALGHALRDGASLPPVSLLEDPSGLLLLDPESYDENGLKSGGHHRALAHLHYGCPLRGSVREIDYPIEDHLIFDERAGPTSIEDVVLAWDDFARQQYDKRIKRFDAYSKLSDDELAKPDLD